MFLPYRIVNTIVNAAIELYDEDPIYPNIPNFMRTHLDPFLKELTSKTFKVQMFDKHNQERLSASVSTCFRDFDEAVLYRAIANTMSIWCFLAQDPEPCGSLSESHQTMYF